MKAGRQQRAEIRISGQMTSNYTKVEKKYLRSIRIPTGEDYFVQVTNWIPNTPAYSKAPKICLTLNNYKDKIQILFPTALDLHEFTRVLYEFINEQLKEMNQAHAEAIQDYSDLHEMMLKYADEKALRKAENEFNNQKEQNNETV